MVPLLAFRSLIFCQSVVQCYLFIYHLITMQWRVISLASHGNLYYNFTPAAVNLNSATAMIAKIKISRSLFSRCGFCLSSFHLIPSSSVELWFIKQDKQWKKKVPVVSFKMWHAFGREDDIHLLSWIWVLCCSLEYPKLMLRKMEKGHFS